MLLSQTAEYALRAMASLTIQGSDNPIRADDLSRSTGIPSHYLRKILRRLVLAGVLESRKGYGGGFTLTRAPGKIRFQDILAAVDAYPMAGRCAFGWDSCDARRPCPLHGSWSRIGDSVRQWAARTTLAAVEAPPSRKKRTRSPSPKRPGRPPRRRPG
jgi:Rrf2 family protein